MNVLAVPYLAQMRPRSTIRVVRELKPFTVKSAGLRVEVEGLVAAAFSMVLI